jgi:hypothetical protein
MDLPKEIRLMVYEELPIVTQRHDIPLRDRQHHLTVVNTTIAGISVLGASRKVNQEAAYILGPHLREMLQAPPKILIEANHLIGMVKLRDNMSLSGQETVLDRIIQAISTGKWAIRQYRKGKLSVQILWKWLRLKDLVDAGDEATLEAIASFILRVAAYIKTKPDTIFKFPPLTVIIVVPDILSPQPITITTTFARALWYRLLQRRNGPHRPGTIHRTASLRWSLYRFVWDAFCTCVVYREVSISIKMKREGWDGNVNAVHQVSEHSFRAILEQAVQDTNYKGKRLVSYGGIAAEEAQER